MSAAAWPDAGTGRIQISGRPARERERGKLRDDNYIEKDDGQ